MSVQELNWFQRTLIWLAGKDIHTAALCNSSEVNKLCTAGTMVVIPPLMALFSWGYALNLIFDSLLLGVLGGIVSAIILLLIDRAIMGYGKDGEFSLGMFGRVLFACTIGFLLAEPFVLRIFQDRVDEHLSDTLRENKELVEKEYSVKIDALARELLEHRQHLITLQEAYTQEMDGNGSPFGAGQGKIYARKLQDYQSFKEWLVKKEEAVKQEKALLLQARQQDLEALESNIANGLTGRLRAIHDIANEEPIVKVALWLLRLTFLCIELIPLFIKITPSTGKNLYESIIMIKKDEQEEVINELSNARKEVITKEQKLAYDKRLVNVELEKLKLLIGRSEQEGITRIESQEKVLKKYLEHKSSKNEGKFAEEEIPNMPKAAIESIIADHINLLNELEFKPNTQ